MPAQRCRVADLITLEQAKDHLRIPRDTSDADNDVLLKMRTAQAVILDYIADTTDADWTATLAAWDETTVPAQVAHAILIETNYLFRFRGDDPPDGDQSDDIGNLAPGVKALLYRLRKLVIA